jgi:uncharacterized protein with PQ loop repeat
MRLSQLLGLAGTGIVAAAYIPQIRHLVREHYSAGISIRAHCLWFVGALFFLACAAMIGDVVFTLAQVLSVVAICVIVILARRYENQFCPSHSRLVVPVTRLNSLRAGWHLAISDCPATLHK